MTTPTGATTETSVTIKLPEKTYRRLDEIVRALDTTVHRLYHEMAALVVAGNDAETRFVTQVLRHPSVMIKCVHNRSHLINESAIMEVQWSKPDKSR